MRGLECRAKVGVKGWGATLAELAQLEPATLRRNEKNHLPCRRPKRKKEAYAKSREVPNSGGGANAPHFRPGRPCLSAVSCVSWVSRR